VIDDGVGIPLESQRHVFERFFRAEQPGTEGVGGTGIGLSLVKAIVETHKGRVWFESEFQKGTSFFISLPLATSPETKPEVA
jgi:signal transduction histidine kinase